MINKSNYIIIGSTGRNTGKTEFACRLIDIHSKERTVIGIKVVAINKNEGSCPRGGTGCGICSSLKGDYEIIQEKDRTTKKDTSRMLQSGATASYLVKVDKKKVEKGIKAVVKLIPENAFVVVESNSARTAIEPGLFLVIKNLNENTVKPSCAHVIEFANKVIEFDNKQWDFQPDRIHIKNNSWIIKEKATAIILAGGKSSRMGGDKSMLPINGVPMVKHIADQLEGHFDEILIGANDKEKYSFLNYPVISDRDQNKGPLMGILSCLDASANKINFITACDIPVMNLRLIHNMINLAAESEIVMPVSDGEKHEPLYAVYRKSIAKHAEKIIKKGGRRIIDLFDHILPRLVDFNDANWYQNLNYKKDYLDFVKKNNTIECYRKDKD